jgi:hypothetical protein
MAADLAIQDYADGGRVGELVAAWLVAKCSPHTRAAHLRELARWASSLAAYSVSRLEADDRDAPDKRHRSATVRANARRFAGNQQGE